MRQCKHCALWSAQQTRCCYIVATSKELLGPLLSPGPQKQIGWIPMSSISHPSLPFWFTGCFHPPPWLLCCLPSATPDPGLVGLMHCSPIFQVLAWILAVSGCVGLPKWGVVPIPGKLGYLVFGVSLSVPRDTVFLSLSGCVSPMRPGQKYQFIPALQQVPHLCPLATGLLPGYCTWTFRIMFPN